MTPRLCTPRSICLCSSFLLFAVGCGDESATPTTDQAAVSGTVTYDGTPITLDSTIMFSCQDPAVNASGKIDSLGNYSLRAADPKVGIPVGRYRVSIRPPDVATAAPNMNDPDYQKMMMSGGSAAKMTPTTPKDIPAKFTSPDSSGIVLELKPGPNTYDFDLAKLNK